MANTKNVLFTTARDTFINASPQGGTLIAAVDSLGVSNIKESLGVASNAYDMLPNNSFVNVAYAVLDTRQETVILPKATSYDTFNARIKLDTVQSPALDAIIYIQSKDEVGLKTEVTGAFVKATGVFFWG